MKMTKTTVPAPLVASKEVQAARKHPFACLWSEEHEVGRQGDVVIQKLSEKDPRLDRAAIEACTQRLDRVVARGSRAAHTASPEATVYLMPNGMSLVVSASPWALTHDDPSHAHDPHVCPAGAYLTWQQVEDTPQGIVPVHD